MKYIKDNKLTVFIMAIFIVIVIIGSYFYNLFFTSGRIEAYGNRLDGIASVTITQEQYDSINNTLKENTNVVNVNSYLKGKILNVIITVGDKVNKDAAKKIANTVISSKILSDSQLEFYDIQVFVKKDNATLNDFPIIGYKQNSSKDLTWSKDRQVTKNEETK